MSRGRLTIGLGDIITFSEKERLIIIKKWCWIARGEREEDRTSRVGMQGSAPPTVRTLYVVVGVKEARAGRRVLCLRKRREGPRDLAGKTNRRWKKTAFWQNNKLPKK
jgi:hypothetical protein